MKKIPLHNLLEKIFGIGKINSVEGIDQLLVELKKLPPDTVLIGDIKQPNKSKTGQKIEECEISFFPTYKPKKPINSE